MSDKKAVFFDADGTICDMEKGVPDSAVESIKKLITPTDISMASAPEEAVRLYPGIWNRFRLQESSVHVGLPSKKMEKDCIITKRHRR